MLKRWIVAGLVGLAFPVAAAGPCRDSCRDLARSCKVRCSTYYGISMARHHCKRDCVAREHRCRAGCY